MSQHGFPVAIEDDEAIGRFEKIEIVVCGAVMLEIIGIFMIQGCLIGGKSS